VIVVAEIPFETDLAIDQFECQWKLQALPAWLTAGFGPSQMVLSCPYRLADNSISKWSSRTIHGIVNLTGSLVMDHIHKPFRSIASFGPPAPKVP
jgi:hypothetical protein